MNQALQDDPLYRVWIGRYSSWHPRHWSDVPPHAEAVEPFDSQVRRRAAARQVVEGFNRQMLERTDRWWAIAVPVRLRIDDEPQRGQPITNANAKNESASTLGRARCVTRGYSNRPSVRDKH